MGDMRSDGYVFKGYKNHKNGKRYEGWTTLDKFLRVHKLDFFERREARLIKRKEKQDKKDEWQIKINHLASLSEDEKKNKAKERRANNKDSRRKADKEYRLKNKNNDAYIQRNKDAQRRHYLKKNEVKIEARKEARRAKAISNEAKRIERSNRLVERAKKKDEEELAKSLRPKRVFLTADQRKENERQGKRNYKHVRRARINNCEVKATPKIIEEAKKNAGDRCYYCGRKCKLTLDHFESLAKGGAHCVSNIVFACFSCNSRKRDLDPFEFMASNLAIGF